MLITSLPGVAWARLRSWASDRRDQRVAVLQYSRQEKHITSQMEALLSILDSAENLRKSHPVVAGQLWRSANQLAKKLGYKE